MTESVVGYAGCVISTVVVLAVFTVGIHTELQQFRKLFRRLHISIQVSPQTTTLCVTDSYEFKFRIFSYYSDLLPYAFVHKFLLFCVGLTV